MALGYELERSYAAIQYGDHVRKMFFPEMATGDSLKIFF